jgi:hypothetical protein
MRILSLSLAGLVTLGGGSLEAKPPQTPAPAAVEAAPVNWDGEWSLEADRSDRIEEQIDAQLKDLNFALRLFWKKKLRAACPDVNKLDILAGDGFSVTMGKERSIDTPADGTETDWKRSDDETFKATLSRNGPTMIQLLRGDGYTLQQVYSMRKDGQSLALQVTYTHPKLANPFSYKLVFRRND